MSVTHCKEVHLLLSGDASLAAACHTEWGVWVGTGLQSGNTWLHLRVKCWGFVKYVCLCTIVYSYVYAPVFYTVIVAGNILLLPAYPSNYSIL